MRAAVSFSDVDVVVVVVVVVVWSGHRRSTSVSRPANVSLTYCRRGTLRRQRRTYFCLSVCYTGAVVDSDIVVATSWCRWLHPVNWVLYSIFGRWRYSTVNSALAACVQKISYVSYRTQTPSTECHTNKAKNRLPRQRPLGDRGTNFWLIIYSHCFTVRENLTKIGPVDVEVITLKEIVKY